MNKTAMLFTLDVDANVTKATEKENLEILRQRLHLSTEYYGGYNLTRQAYLARRTLRVVSDFGAPALRTHA